MAQPLKKEEGINPFFSDKQITFEELAAQQGVKPVENLDDLKGGFWPEEESIDDFIRTLYQWRREGLPGELPE
jgi:hypothetical protein